MIITSLCQCPDVAGKGFNCCLPLKDNDPHRERLFPSDARMSRFRDLAVGFLALPLPPGRIRQQFLGHMASLECFFLEITVICTFLSGSSRTFGLPCWTLHISQYLCHRSARKWFIGGPRRRGGFGHSPAGSSFLSASAHGCLSVGLGAHLLNLMASGVWSHCSRDAGSGADFGRLSSPVAQTKCGSYERQRHVSGVLEKLGGHSLAGDVPHGQRDNSVIRAPFGYPVRSVRSRQEECLGRSAEPSRPSHSSLA